MGMRSRVANVVGSPVGAALRERKRPREEAEEREPPGVASQMRGVHGHDGCCSAGGSLELREEASSGSHPLLLCRSSLLLPPLPSSFSLRARHTSSHKPAPEMLLFVHTVCSNHTNPCSGSTPKNHPQNINHRDPKSVFHPQRYMMGMATLVWVCKTNSASRKAWCWKDFSSAEGSRHE